MHGQEGERKAKGRAGLSKSEREAGVSMAFHSPSEFLACSKIQGAKPDPASLLMFHLGVVLSLLFNIWVQEMTYHRFLSFLWVLYVFTSGGFRV